MKRMLSRIVGGTLLAVVLTVSVSGGIVMANQDEDSVPEYVEDPGIKASFDELDENLKQHLIELHGGRENHARNLYNTHIREIEALIRRELELTHKDDPDNWLRYVAYNRWNFERLLSIDQTMASYTGRGEAAKDIVVTDAVRDLVLSTYEGRAVINAEEQTVSTFFGGEQFTFFGFGGHKALTAAQQQKLNSGKVTEMLVSAGGIQSLLPILEQAGIEIDPDRPFSGTLYALKGGENGELIKITLTCKHCAWVDFDSDHQSALVEKDDFNMFIKATNMQSPYSRVVALKATVSYADVNWPSGRFINEVCWQATDDHPRFATRARYLWDNIAEDRSTVKRNDWVLDDQTNAEARMRAVAGSYDSVTIPANPSKLNTSSCGTLGGHSGVPGITGGIDRSDNTPYNFDLPGRISVSIQGFYKDYMVEHLSNGLTLVEERLYDVWECTQRLDIFGNPMYDENGNPDEQCEKVVHWKKVYTTFDVYRFVPYRDSHGNMSQPRWEPSGGSFNVGRPGSLITQ